MTAEAFIRWLAAMKAADLAKSDAACAKLLGLSPNWIVKLKKNGADVRMALACQALLQKLEPYA
jgi:hypothetical protein